MTITARFRPLTVTDERIAKNDAGQGAARDNYGSSGRNARQVVAISPDRPAMRVMPAVRALSADPGRAPR
jgi:hypothetical protein